MFLSGHLIIPGFDIFLFFIKQMEEMQMFSVLHMLLNGDAAF